MHETDVLVVGGGGAACFAAVHAKRMGAETTLVCKGRVGKSGATVLAGAGIQMDGKSACEMGYPGDSESTKEKLFREIVLEGFYLNNQRLVEVFCRDAAARIKELLHWGLRAEFSPPGSFGMPGIELARACSEGVKTHDVELVEDTMITDILLHKGKVAGAVGIDINSGEFVLFKAKAVVLGTGGWHQAYPFTTGSNELTGDGQAAAYGAGAELINMEMVTYCPNILLSPPMHRGSILPIILAMFTEAKMLNNKGADIMKYYDPKIVEIAETTEFNKNIWSIASAREIMAGRGTPHGGIWVSMKHLPLQIFDTVEKRWFQKEELDLWRQLKEGYAVEVAPAAHYFDGGVAINENCETNVPGLYAAGECSSGTFGANRVCDATTEMVVLGGVAGRCAGEYAKRKKAWDMDPQHVEAIQRKRIAPLEREQGLSPIEMRKKIQQIADGSVGVIRSGSNLNKAIEELERVRVMELPKLCVAEKSRKYNVEWIESVEVENMLLCVEASAKSALMRTESRGVHYRTDHLNMDNVNWQKEIVVKEENGKMQLGTRPVIMTIMEPLRAPMTWEQYITWVVPPLKELGVGK